MNIFAYGTLMDADIMRQVCGAEFYSRAARLDGYQRKKLRGEVYPGIVALGGSCVTGLVYFDISPTALHYLDQFEGTEYQRTRVTAVGEDGECIAAETYVLTPQAAALLSDEDWNLEDFVTRDKPLFQDQYGGYQALE